MQSVPGLFIEAVYVVCEWRCLGLCEPVSAVRFMNIATFNDKCLVGYFISAPRPVLEKLKEFMDGNFYTLVSGIHTTRFENMNHISFDPVTCNYNIADLMQEIKLQCTQKLLIPELILRGELLTTIGPLRFQKKGN